MTKTISAILENLENVTATYSAPRVGQAASHMYEGDLNASVDALTELIKYNAANTTKPLSNQHDISNMVKTSSNLLRLTNLPAWKTALKVRRSFILLLTIKKRFLFGELRACNTGRKILS